MIGPCGAKDFAAILDIVNDAAQAYRGVIPADRWHEPYMAAPELRAEIAAGVEFWGAVEDGALAGVMGVQDKGEVALLRHAYVRTAARRRGVGGRLLRFICERAGKPILIGTWATADWAIDFYRKHDFQLVPAAEKDVLLRRFWTVPERQMETSVVLASPDWRSRTASAPLE
jgi:GNAT superfamily N-acetyltransferase